MFSVVDLDLNIELSEMNFSSDISIGVPLSWKWSHVTKCIGVQVSQLI